MLKILQARLQQYVNHELTDVQAGFRKVRRTRDHIANIHWIIKKGRRFQKKIYFCFITMPKPLCGSQQTVKNYSRDGIPDHLTCLLRNLYADQEATVRTWQGITGWFQIRKGVCQRSIFLPCFLNLYAEYIMRNAGLDEAQSWN